METRSFLSGTAQPFIKKTAIEGSLTLPQTLPDIAAVLTATGTAQTDEAACTPQGIGVKGRAFFQILYLDTEGIPRSFDAQCGYSCEIEQDMGEAVAAAALARFEDIAVKESPRRVDLRAQLVVTATAACNRTFETTDGGEDCEKQEGSHMVTVIADVTHALSTAAGNIVIPQSLPEVKEVLMAAGAAEITAVHRDIERIAVEGEIKLGIVYMGSDRNAPIQYMSENVPFSEIIPVKGEGEPLVSCAAARIFVEKGDEPDTLTYSCATDIGVIMTGREEVRLLEDAYSTTHVSQTIRGRVDTCELIGIPQQRRVIRAGAVIPETCPEASRVLLTMVTPSIREARAAKGAVSVEGTLICTVCYTTAGLGVRSAKLSIPFETELSAPVSEEMWVSVDAQCEYAAAEGSGRELELRACLSFCGTAFDYEEMDTVTELRCGEPLERDGGIMLYFADPDESDWDILKRFRVSGDHMKDMGEGRRMILI